MQASGKTEAILNLPLPSSSVPERPPRATMAEYIDFIQFILDTTDAEQIARQKQREDKGNLARFSV